jgi:Tfp pilus assembly protein PilV
MGLLDSVIALAIFAFGMLSMTRFQARLIADGTDAQARMVATRVADDLLSLVLVDPGNAACYTVPAEGACGNAAARAAAEQWRTAAEASLQGMAVRATRDAASNRFEVTLSWTGKDGQDRHELRAASYAR